MVRQKYLQLMNEAAQSLCPPASSLRLSRVDTKRKHVHSSIYDADRTYFLVKRRDAFIRQARCGEFDYSPDSHALAETYRDVMGFEPPLKPNDALRSVVKYIPKLWCLVSHIAPGTHSVTTVYRGDAFFKVYECEGQTIADLRNADKLTLTLEAMHARMGYDAAAWELYCKKLAAECMTRAVTAYEPNSGPIH
jgi:hypothetical protein